MEEITNEGSFTEMLGKSLSAVYYFTDNCGVCHVLKPKVKDMFYELGIPIGSMNLMKHAALAGQQLIMGVPTLIIYQNGKEIIREGAYMQLHELRKKLASMASTM